jgi:alanyl-tRNA synthetase
VGHVVDRELEKNSRVRGHVDWIRRFDHMQQHTGQHLLSAAFEREVGAKTVSFHLGTSAATIDLDKELSAGQISRVEDTVNNVLWEDREICVKFVTTHEAAKLPLRKDPARAGDLRIIEIKDYDLSACGGTHVRSTGAIGIVAIAGFERFKSGMRVEFLCGYRALQGYRASRRSVSAGVRLLSVLPEELPAAIERLQTTNKQLQKTQEGLYERLAIHEAGRLVGTGDTVGATTVVASIVQGWDANGLKKLAAAIVSRPSTVTVLVSSESPSLIVVARSQDLPLETGEVLKQLIGQFGGKGGGKGSLAQGGGLTGSTDEILKAAQAHIQSKVHGP